jgi:MFS family permease
MRSRWWIAGASLTAQLVGSGAINVFAFAVFLKPVANDLGVGRGVLSSALLMSTLMTAVGCLGFGALFDRIRIRTTLLLAVTLYAVSVGALSLLRPSLAIIYALFGLSGFFGSGQTPLGYSKLIAQWFDRDRGLAMGIIQAGVGLGGIFVAQLARFLIGTFGWREAYIGVGSRFLLWRSSRWRCFCVSPIPCLQLRKLQPRLPEKAVSQSGPLRATCCARPGNSGCSRSRFFWS